MLTATSNRNTIGVRLCTSEIQEDHLSVIIYFTYCIMYHTSSSQTTTSHSCAVTYDSLLPCQIILLCHMYLLQYVLSCLVTYNSFLFVRISYQYLQTRLYVSSSNLMSVLCWNFFTALCQKFVSALRQNYLLVLWHNAAACMCCTLSLCVRLPACPFECLTRQHRIVFGLARFYFRAREWGRLG